MTQEQLNELLWVDSELRAENLPKICVVPINSDKFKETPKAIFDGMKWWPKSQVEVERTTDTKEYYMWVPKWLRLKKY